MRTDVDQRTAALLCLIREYAPGRNATAAEVCSLCIVNIAKNAGIDNLLSNLVLRGSDDTDSRSSASCRFCLFASSIFLASAG